MDTIIKDTILFSQHYDGVGLIEIRSFNLDRDKQLIHDWVTKPYAQYWGMQGFSLAQVEEEYKKLESYPNHKIFIGILNNTPIFLMEQYNPANDCIADHYEVLEGDVGMHILVAPAQKRIPKLTWLVFSFVMDFLFTDKATKRIVVEPDVNNQKIHKLNTKAGFSYLKEVKLPHKTAHLAVCEYKDYENAKQINNKE